MEETLERSVYKIFWSSWYEMMNALKKGRKVEEVRRN